MRKFLRFFGDGMVPGQAPRAEKGERLYIAQSNYCKPIKVRDPQTGQETEKSLIFSCGERYFVPDSFPELKQLLEIGALVLADDPAPRQYTAKLGIINAELSEDAKRERDEEDRRRMRIYIEECRAAGIVPMMPLPDASRATAAAAR
jgi:hypothetical protein